MSTYPMTIRLVDLDDALRIRDLTDPTAGRHALQLIATLLTDALAAAWSCDVRRVTGRRVVSLADNYDLLGYETDAVTRDARYTRYVEPDRVLRSHSTAMIPAALRRLAADHVRGVAPPDVLLASPGICYRRDSVDWQHTGTPHQMDLWRVVHGGATGSPGSPAGCTSSDLDEMVALVVAAALPGSTWRTTPVVHPYTIGGRQIDVQRGDAWIEIGECGLIAPDVLTRAGLDASRWSGLALGLGLDRLMMLRKAIPDIRLLRSDDPRVAHQMLDLEPYRPVSHMPPVRRDLSLAVDELADLSAEALGDRVRTALGVDADAVESVHVVAVTEYDDVPASARRRLGMRRGQANALLRLVLRPLDRSLTDLEANQLRDRIYAALHEGDVHEWAVSPRPMPVSPGTAR
jgi:phenylalanyl-tRNA synthetase alpha chain